MNPNEAFKDRNGKPSKPRPLLTIIFNSTHVVTFTCTACGYTYNIVFEKGETFYPDNLICSGCHKAGMAYQID
jgi:hypothetical protein